MRVPKKRAPTHPGEMLMKEFLEPMSITQRELADAIHVPYQRVNELVNGKRGMTPSTAVRLSAFFGNSSEFWLNLQQAWELYHVLKEEEEELKAISRFKGKEERVSLVQNVN
jgi:addiction module HigA family antidote